MPRLAWQLLDRLRRDWQAVHGHGLLMAGPLHGEPQRWTRLPAVQIKMGWATFRKRPDLSPADTRGIEFMLFDILRSGEMPALA